MENKMSRQVQIRRGSATAHTNFTGAIGEITMDTTNKTLRVHDGETVGGIKLAKQSEIPTVPDFPVGMDYVIESQFPTAENNYTWYRKYKSGWVEQGGFIPSGIGTSNTLTLPVEMADDKYTVVSNTTNNAANNYFRIANKTATTFTWYKSSNSMGGDWMVIGIAA